MLDAVRAPQGVVPRVPTVDKERARDLLLQLTDTLRVKDLSLAANELTPEDLEMARRLLHKVDKAGKKAETSKKKKRDGNQPSKNVSKKAKTLDLVTKLVLKLSANVNNILREYRRPRELHLNLKPLGNGKKVWKVARKMHSELSLLGVAAFVRVVRLGFFFDLVRYNNGKVLSIDEAVEPFNRLLDTDYSKATFVDYSTLYYLWLDTPLIIFSMDRQVIGEDFNLTFLVKNTNQIIRAVKEYHEICVPVPEWLSEQLPGYNPTMFKACHPRTTVPSFPWPEEQRLDIFDVTIPPITFEEDDLPPPPVPPRPQAPPQIEEEPLVIEKPLEMESLVEPEPMGSPEEPIDLPPTQPLSPSFLSRFSTTVSNFFFSTPDSDEPSGKEEVEDN